jgi:LEA14-like dessication related protein
MNDNENITMEHKPKKPSKSKSKRIKIIVIIVIIIILLAALLDLFLVYSAASSLDVDPKRIESLKPVTLQDYELDFILTLKNPSGSEIEVEKITYDIYLENDYIGSGERVDFTIQPGDHDQTFKFQFNIFDLAAAVLNHLLSSNGRVKIVGKVTVPLKILRLEGR